MALIEKGQDVSIFKDNNELHGRYNALKFGILAFGVGLGLIFANILDVHRIMDEDIAYFAMITLFGGLALIVYYLLLRRIKPEKKD